MDKKKTIPFEGIPDLMWNSILPRIVELYTPKVRGYYENFGRNWLGQHLPNDESFFGFKAAFERLPLIIESLTSGGYACSPEKNESGSVILAEDGETIEDVIIDPQFETLSCLFKTLDFLVEKERTPDEFQRYAEKLTGGPLGYGPIVLMNYCNALIGAPMGIPEDENIACIKELMGKLKKESERSNHGKGVLYPSKKQFCKLVGCFLFC